MQDLLRPVLEQIGKLWSRVDLSPVIRWGTVTQASPLRVQLDGDEDPLTITPQNAAGELRVDSRVLCVEQHRRVIVVKASGDRAAWASASGTVPSASVGADATVTTAVTFPVGRFTSPPVVIASAVAGAASYLYVSVESVTTTSFVLRRSVGAERGSGFSLGAAWQATQMTAGSASG